MSPFLEDHSSAFGHWVKGDPKPLEEATITSICIAMVIITTISQVFVIHIHIIIIMII